MLSSAPTAILSNQSKHIYAQIQFFDKILSTEVLKSDLIECESIRNGVTEKIFHQSNRTL